MRVLISRQALERVGERLPAGVTAVVMEDDGSFSVDGAPIEGDQAALDAAWGTTDVYTGGLAARFMVACLQSDSLRWFQTSSAGFDHPVFGALVDKGLTLTNSDASAPAIAEFVLAAVLDHYQPQALRRQLQAARRWERTPFRELAGTTWIVVGLGAIGRAIAARARAFDVRVVGVRRHPRGDAPVDEELALDQLGGRVQQADVLVLAAPANAESQGLVGAELLARMKPRSVLVNIARGTLVDEAALLTALDRGVPELAILDVFETEPLPADSKLWSHAAVRVSAHNAPNSDGFVRRGDQVFLDNLRRYVAGEPLLRVVEPAVVKASVQGNR